MSAGGKKRSLQLEQAATPAQCLNYTLDLGANSTVFGIKTVEELQENFKSFKSEKKVDYNHIVKIFEGYEYLSS